MFLPSPANITFMNPRSSALGFVCALLSVALQASLIGAQQAEAKPAGLETSTPTPNPILVELFTSEGCSSCPPADLLLQKMDTQPIAGAQLIVLSEHVTYWDHDGWKDPNSSSVLTDRQSSYESALRHDTSFTPQIIVDGTEEIRVGNPQHISDVLHKEKDDPKLPVHITQLAIDPGNPNLLRARIETDANPGKRTADVYVALALSHVESQVLRGENGGRHLVHVAVVQQLTKLGKLPKGSTFAQEVQLQLAPGTDPDNLRLIAFVQEPGPGRLVGAAMERPGH